MTDYRKNIVHIKSATNGQFDKKDKNLIINTDYLMNIWDNDNNPDIDITKETRNSEKQANFRCKVCGYSWPQIIHNKRNDTCPCCSRQVIVMGINDNFTLIPGLKERCKEELNPGVDMAKISFRDLKQYNWWCPDCEQIWPSLIRRQFKRIDGKYVLNPCPYCSGKANTISWPITPKYNLEVLFPQLKPEWSNKNSKPMNQYHPYTNAIALWNCPKCGKEYPLAVRDRTAKGRECPDCRDHKIIKFADAFPELKDRYCDDNEIPFNQEYRYSEKKAWFYCDNGHKNYVSFAAITENKGKVPCKYCCGHAVVRGENDLATTNSDLVNDEWDYIANITAGFKQPYEYSNVSDDSVWWKCKVCKTEYKKKICDKVINEKRGITSCYHCADRQLNKVLLVKNKTR